MTTDNKDHVGGQLGQAFVAAVEAGETVIDKHECGYQCPREPVIGIFEIAKAEEEFDGGMLCAEHAGRKFRELQETQ